MDRPIILIIIPNLGYGGAQQVFYDQLQFYSMHFQIIGCVFNWEGALEKDKKFPIVSLGIPAGRNVISKIYYFIKRIYKLRQLKHERHVQISISHLEGADYVNILSRRNEKVITWIHGTKKFDRNIDGLLGWLRKGIMIPVLYKKSDLIVTVSDGIKEELGANFNLPSDSMRTIVNGFSVDEIQRKASEHTVFTDKMKGATLLITHCRLARQKNLSALLKIFSIDSVKEKSKLVIVGDGELRDELLTLCVTLNLSSFTPWRGEELHSNYDVYFLGYQSNPFQFLSKASLFVMTSAWEGFPLALGEAMACRIPVMVADCHTGPREIIAPDLSVSRPVTQATVFDSGILMPLASSEDSLRIWAETICTVLQSRSLTEKLSKGGIECIRRFDKKEIERQWLELIDLLIK